MIVGGAFTALSAVLLPEDFWFGVLALCGIGTVWVIWHYIYVDCRQPRTPPVQTVIHEQASHGMFGSVDPGAIQVEERMRLAFRKQAEKELEDEV
jgi:hypothetical protein